MMDFATRRRQLMLAAMSRDVSRYLHTLFGSKNAHGIYREELAYWISDRLALVVIAVTTYGVWYAL